MIFARRAVRSEILGDDSLKYTSSEIGDVASDVVATYFNTGVYSSGGDYALGVTITVNAVQATILSSARQSETHIIYYTLDAAVDGNDVLTWEYSGGDLEKNGKPTIVLLTVSAQDSTNYVGTHWWFDVTEDSGQLLTIGL